MSIINTGTEGLPSEPFRTYAERYLDIGLSVVPCDKGDGKLPSVNWKWLQTRHVGGKLLDKWLVTFANANIGVVTGKKSGITVIDCDNPEVTPMELCATYGNTPLIAKTPSGGTHLYYRHNSEGTAAGIAPKIDIRGEGGLIIAPPSYNHKTGELYHFIEGDILDIRNLPVMKNNSEIQRGYNEKQRGYNEGERNKALFNYLKIQAASCNDIAVLNELAELFNQQRINPQLDTKEIQRTIKSIWGYKARGTLSNNGEQFITLPMQKLKSIMFTHPKAFALYADLISCHSGINKTFAISPKAYAKRCGWSANTIRQEIQTLLLHGLIKQVYEGGKYKGDVTLYRLQLK